MSPGMNESRNCQGSMLEELLPPVAKKQKTTPAGIIFRRVVP